MFDAAGRPADQSLQLDLISDQVMGGVSSGSLDRTEVEGRPALRLTGEVRLENNGGFIQMAGDLPDSARGARGIALQLYGNDETYGCHLRTEDVTRPWQSFRCAFHAPSRWTRVELHFEDFERHRIEAPLRVERLRRLGLVAIGRAFRADLAIARVDLLL